MELYSTKYYGKNVFQISKFLSSVCVCEGGGGGGGSGGSSGSWITDKKICEKDIRVCVLDSICNNCTWLCCIWIVYRSD